MTDDLILANDNKIIFLVLDGLGDIPDPAHSFMTPLEAAKKPNMDRLAVEKGVLGRTIPVGIGITPGSGPGHLGLFGYDPVRYEIGRGILEVLGLDMDLAPSDVAARGNFCTVRDGIVVDRRAGRIETSVAKRLCERLSQAIPAVDGVKVIIKPGVSHRFGIIFRGEGLSDELEDADPHKDGMPFRVDGPEDAGGGADRRGSSTPSSRRRWRCSRRRRRRTGSSCGASRKTPTYPRSPRSTGWTPWRSPPIPCTGGSPRCWA